VRIVIILLAATIAWAMPFDAKAALQCVTYAREITGFNLKGDAWRWWEAADGLYDRGNAPRDGSVLVFKRQGSMSHGHVAVVRKVMNSRIVLVDHANWAPHRSAGRGQVTQGVPVMDVSAANDWSQVRVWYRPSNEYGSRVYKTQGFVYRPGHAPLVQQASLRAETVAPAVTAAPAPVAAAATPLPVAPASAAPAPVAAKAEPAPQPVKTQDKPAAPAVTAAPASVDNTGRFDAQSWAEQA
jgi:hypothetical protein